MSIPGFDVEVDDHERDQVVAHVRGEVDLYTAPKLRERLMAATDGVNRLVLDLREVTFLDSTGISVIVSVLKRMREGGGDLVLRSPTEAVRKVLEMTRLDNVLTIEG